MIVDPDFLDHWRTRMLVDLLGEDEFAPFYLLRLWGHCQSRKATRFEMPAAGLKALCKASCEAAALEAALIEAGYIKRDGAFIEVLKWAEQNASLVAAWGNGHKGGRPKKEPKQNPAETQQEPSGNPEETQQEPGTNPSETQKQIGLTHAKPIREEKKGEEVSTFGLVGEADPKPGLPNCPHQAIVEHYHEVLPELPRVKLMSEARKKAISAFWRWVLTSKKSDGTPRASTADQALTWIRQYFERARLNDFLMGRTQRGSEHANWRCDLDFLLTERGKRHVIEKTVETTA